MVEILSCRKVDLCCVQETRYRGGHWHIIKGRLKVQTVLVAKQQRYCWCWSVCGGEVDREGI